jgi:NadR type nicotinamide-nucleotide adenylyltransferase
MRKIVIIGPESTGKSTLCEQLAAHYQTVWCQEYAREYLLKNGTDYTYDQLLEIAKGQLVLEEQVEQQAHQHYFIDTNMYVMKVWCEVVFDNCHKWILNQIVQRPYDLYLLCNVDLPWIKDELREYPDLAMREKLYKMYKDLLIHDGTPWAVVSGTEEERLQTAIQHIERTA